MNSTTALTKKLSSLREYQELCKSSRLDCPEYFNFGTDVVDRWARERPDQPAMRWVSSDGQNRWITFAEVSSRSNQVANGLLQLGLRHGDQVLVELPNLVEWWETMTARFWLGLEPQDLHWNLSDTG